MNIFLVPYTWLRHLQLAIATSGAALMAWWMLMAWFVLVGPFWSIGMDGPIYLCTISAAVAGTSVLGESTLRRQALGWRLSRTLLAAGVGGGFTLLWSWLFTWKTAEWVFGEDVAIDVGDPSLVTLRYRVGAFVLMGVCTSIGPVIVRRGAGLFTHLIAGAAAGVTSAAVWHYCNFEYFHDLYLAGGLAAMSFGGTFGLLAWGIPDELYAGWLRVLSPNRFGLRIPVDALDRTPKERFLGHFPRGLDMWLPVEDGVLELHASVAVDDKQRYKGRGLTLHPVRVKRLLERIDIRYDPRRPAPLETRLKSGDRLELGEGEQSTQLEFLMLPREER